jgi:hypothetical protein
MLTTKAGLVLWISAPIDGSRLMRQISPLFMEQVALYCRENSQLWVFEIIASKTLRRVTQATFVLYSELSVEQFANDFGDAALLFLSKLL